ncbi:MAG: hypothetical protein MPJ50_04795 [Pirellulales bacterium]|nr:hypothetical protein [Pirellulales bacterium]
MTRHNSPFAGHCAGRCSILITGIAALFGAMCVQRASALSPRNYQDQQTKIEFSGYSVQAPKKWKQEKPRNRIVNFEFSISPAQGDQRPGRFTLMNASGSVEANLERWYGQFTQPDGSSTKDKAKVEKKELASLKVVVVDIPGTFKDQAGPFAPATMRENYRMLAAIIPTAGGTWFAKFVGPAKTVEENAKAFQAMLESLKKN